MHIYIYICIHICTRHTRKASWFLSCMARWSLAARITSEQARKTTYLASTRAFRSLLHAHSPAISLSCARSCPRSCCLVLDLFLYLSGLRLALSDFFLVCACSLARLRARASLPRSLALPRFLYRALLRARAHNLSCSRSLALTFPLFLCGLESRVQVALSCVLSLSCARALFLALTLSFSYCFSLPLWTHLVL